MIIYYGPVTLYLINMNFKPVGFLPIFYDGDVQSKPSKSD